eukprot:1161882-Pelagomonas_calceolata.AAC.6
MPSFHQHVSTGFAGCERYIPFVVEHYAECRVSMQSTVYGGNWQAQGPCHECLDQSGPLGQESPKNGAMCWHMVPVSKVPG